MIHLMQWTWWSGSHSSVEGNIVDVLYFRLNSGCHTVDAMHLRFYSEGDTIGAIQWR